MCTHDRVQRHRRYAEDILALHDGLNFRQLLRTGPDRAVYQRRRSSGPVTLGFRTDQLPERYLLGIQGFRLAQYLALGWVCEDAIAAGGMFCEPTSNLRDDDIHVVTLSSEGTILGCLSLTGSPDGVPRRLGDITRSAFPVEQAYGIDLLGGLAADKTSAQVRELRRFVHRRSLTRSDVAVTGHSGVAAGDCDDRACRSVDHPDHRRRRGACRAAAPEGRRFPDPSGRWRVSAARPTRLPAPRVHETPHSQALRRRGASRRTRAPDDAVRGGVGLGRPRHRTPRPDHRLLGDGATSGRDPPEARGVSVGH